MTQILISREEISMKKVLALLTIVIILTLALAACGGGVECEDEWGCATIEKDQTIKVGYVGPTTGDYSSFGIDMSRGAELAVAAHPTIKEFEVELLIEDTQGTPEQGASVANMFAADPRVVAIDGHTHL
jgi:branched-chain amino acid transport system substrate-binding protein